MASLDLSRDAVERLSQFYEIPEYESVVRGVRCLGKVIVDIFADDQFMFEVLVEGWFVDNQGGYPPKTKPSHAVMKTLLREEVKKYFLIIDRMRCVRDSLRSHRLRSFSEVVSEHSFRQYNNLSLAYVCESRMLSSEWWER